MSDASANLQELKKLVKNGVESESVFSHEEIAEWLDDFCYDSYLVAHKTPSAAAKKLLETIRWRLDYRPRTTPCPACTHNPHSHSLRLLGFDSTGNAVTYSDNAHAHNRFDFSNNARHLCYTIENLMVIGKKRGWSGQMVWVVDFVGFSVRDLDPRGSKLATILVSHYPNRLARSYILEPPTLFSGMWKLLKPILDPVTVSKIGFIPKLDGAYDAWRGKASSKTDNGIDRQIDEGEEFAQWMLREATENRKPENRNRRYWQKPSNPSEHDSRGLPSFVNSPFFQLVHAEPFMSKDIDPSSDDGEGTGTGAADETVVGGDLEVD